MIKFIERFVVFLIGAVLYSLLEILFRGFTHWTMSLTGGVALLILYIFFAKYPHENIVLKSLFGATVITLLELFVGLIVNVYLKWNVWDYSGNSYNFMGQICLLFSTIWFFISIPTVFLCNFLKSNLTRILYGSYIKF